MKLKQKKKLKKIYYGIGILFLIVSFFLNPPIETNTSDIILYKLKFILLALSFLTPVFFLGIWNKKNVNKKKNWWAQVFGFILILTGMLTLTSMTSYGFSEDYQSKYQEYLEVENQNDSSYSKNELNEKLENLTEEAGNITNNTVANQEEMKVHYLDVGQGDSIFIELPNKETMLIDASEGSYANQIETTIKKLGYTKIDYIIATHPHADHIGGLAKIIQNFEIGAIYMPKVVTTTKTYENLLTTIASKGLTVKTAKSGITIINQENLKIEIIAPNQEKYKDLNNYSAVLKITYGNRKFLFMGDAEKESEEEIQSDISADVIKVGHHGSNTSSSESFVNKVQPKYAIISVGKDNKYNHPYQEIINRWKNVGAEIYRTDQDGMITITTDGTILKIKTEQGTETTSDNIITKEENLVIQEESIKLINFTSNVKKGENATIQIQGLPNTEYSIKVIYKNGASTSKDLVPKKSDTTGLVSWTWKIGATTTSGTYPIIISDGTKEEEYQITIE